MEATTSTTHEVAALDHQERDLVNPQEWPDVLTAHRFEFRLPPQEFAREIDGLDI